MMKKIVVLVLALLFAQSVVGVSASDEWLDGWDYRRRVMITGSEGAGTDYQILVNVTFDSNMQTDFRDVRFTDNDGLTELDHWLEDYTAATFALFWVEVTDSLDDLGIIYMYYGNPDVSSASNGTATFVLFDDFVGSAEPPTNWGETTIGTLTWSDVSENSYYKVYDFQDSSAEWHGNLLNRTVTPPTTFALVANLNVTCGSTVTNQHDSTVYGFDGGVEKFRIGFIDSWTGAIGNIVSKITGTNVVEGQGTRVGEDFIFEIRRDGTNVKTYWNGNLQQTKATTDTLDEIRIRLVGGRSSSSSNPQTELDYIYIRRYIAVEPFAYDFAGEEIMAASIFEDIFLGTDMIGYIGPLALVFVGWFLVKKDKGLGVIAFIVESLFVAQYLALVEATPDYWWQIFILIFGMLFTVVLPLWDR